MLVQRTVFLCTLSEYDEEPLAEWLDIGFWPRGIFSFLVNNQQAILS